VRVYFIVHQRLPFANAVEAVYKNPLRARAELSKIAENCKQVKWFVIKKHITGFTYGDQGYSYVLFEKSTKD